MVSLGLLFKPLLQMLVLMFKHALWSIELLF